MTAMAQTESLDEAHRRTAKVIVLIPTALLFHHAQHLLYGLGNLICTATYRAARRSFLTSMGHPGRRSPA